MRLASSILRRIRYFLIKLCFTILVAALVYVSIAYDQEWIADAMWYAVLVGGIGVCVYIFVVVPYLAWRIGQRWQVVFFVVFAYGVILFVVLFRPPRHEEPKPLQSENGVSQLDTPPPAVFPPSKPYGALFDSGTQAASVRGGYARNGAGAGLH